MNGTFQDTEFEISFDESPQHTHSLSIEDIRPNKIGVWNMSSQMEKSVEVSSTAASGAAAIITVSTDHDFRLIQVSVNHHTAVLICNGITDLE
mgnify:CR=1 FL=1